MKNICPPQFCTGCQLCRQLCPAGAVSVHLNKKGFHVPEIDENKCTQCGLCTRHCPANTIPVISGRDGSVQRFYAAWHRDKKIRKKSSSGGIFTAVAEMVLAEKGVVFGVRFDRAVGARFDFCETKEGLDLLRGSKYVQADVGDAYRKVADFIKQDRLVLFSGTPCQVAALRSFLHSDPENLITLDLICHGTPSVGSFLRTIDEIEAKNGKKIANVLFRTKKTGWDFLTSEIIWENGCKTCSGFAQIPHIGLFLNDVNLNEACHHCRYTSLERTGDLTIADFWDYRPKLSRPFYWRGVSQIICNTRKGEGLLVKLAPKLHLEEKTQAQASQINHSLKKPFPPAPCREAFFQAFQQGETMEELAKKFCLPTLTTIVPSLPKRITRRGKTLFPGITKCLKKILNPQH